MRKIRALVAGLIVAATAGAAEAQEVKRFWDPASGSFQKVVMAPSKRLMESPIKREVIDYDGPYGKGTIIVNTTERRLYYVMGDGKALKYGIGVGRPGFTWSGTHHITRKAEWPGWTPAGHAQAPAGSALFHAGRPGQSAWRTRHVHRLDHLPHPRDR